MTTIRPQSIPGFLVAVLMTQAINAQTRIPQTESDFNKPMTFQTYQEHAGNAASYYTLAIGEIIPSTPNDFLRYVSRMGNEMSGEVWFHSPGGDLSAGLKLGKIIRQLGLTTRTGGEFSRFHTLFEVKVTVREAKCYSACAWAFLGGKLRILRSDNALGVHQFFTSKGPGSLSVAQVTIAQLSLYLDGMQINRKLLDLASLTPPERVSVLTIAEARNLNIDNSEQTIGRWEIKAAEGTGRVHGVIVEKLPETDDEVTIWVLPDKSADKLLLTISYSTIHSSRTPAEIHSIFSDEQMTEPRIYPGYDDRVGPNIPLTYSKWTKMRDGSYAMNVLISKNSARNLCRYEFFMFDSGMPHCCIDVARRAAIPTKGLGAIISAISSQGALNPVSR